MKGFSFRCRNQADWDVIYLSDGFSELLGWNRNLFVMDRTMNLADLIHPDDQENVWSTVQQAVAHKSSYAVVYRCRHADGQFLWMREIGTCGIDERGMLYLEGFNLPLTEHEKKEQFKLNSHRTYQSMLGSIKEIIFQIDEHGCWRFLNQVWTEILGYQRDETIGRPFYSFLHPKDRERARKWWSRIISKEQIDAVEDFRFLAKSGKAFWMETSGRYLTLESDQSPCVSGTLDDISSAREVIDNLAKRERYLQATVDIQKLFLNSTDDIVPYNQVVTMLGEASGANRCYYFESLEPDNPSATLRMLAEWCTPGTSAEINNPDVSEINLDQTLPRWRERLEKGEIVSSLIDDFDEPLRSFFALQKIKSILIIPVLVQDRFVGILGFDNCEQKRNWSPIDVNLLKAAATSLSTALLRRDIQADLRREERLLQLTLSSLEESVLSFNAAGVILSINRAAEKLLGQSAEKTIGQSLERILPLKDFERNHSLIPEIVGRVLSGERVRSPQNGHLELSNGTRKLAYAAVPILSEKKQIISGGILVLRDMTQEESFNEEIWRATRLESVGLLAGGIAHDFNNLLTAMLGHLELLQSPLADNPPATNSLQQLQGATRKAKELTQQLLTFAKGGSPVKKDANLRQVLQESAEFTAHGQSTPILFDLAEDLWWAQFDSGQISQVIQNLVINAIEASPPQSPLEIRAHNHLLTGEDNLPLSEGPYVCIEVTDQGEGIPANVINRIFDPYFTTKKKGNGLGLATSYSIIRKHHGLLTVSSTAGQGSVFRIYLPACPDSPRKEESDPVPEEVPVEQSAEGKSILVMDDEDTVRDVLVLLLENLGYLAFGVPHGEGALQALDEAARGGSSYDAVLMDLTIVGGMGGKETIAQVRQKYPDQPCIVMSGYSNDPIMSHCQDYGFQGVLQKPFNLVELSRVLDQVLAEK